MSGDTVEIFRSLRRAECGERAFMLAAVGISSRQERVGNEWLLLVDAVDLEPARDHLQKYEVERLLRPQPAAPPPPLHGGAWAGALAYATALLGVSAAISNGWWRLDAFDVGLLGGAEVHAGQWWRAFTALTLHLDASHLAANLGAGVWFGYLAGRMLGVGHAWLLVVLGAGAANWMEGYFGPADHRAVGASTAVFAALGLLCAYSWRVRLRFTQRWALRWGPLVAGLILLGWTGSGAQDANGQPVRDPAVDVVGHALGFSLGVLLGALAASPPGTALLRRLPQWAAGGAAIAMLALSWILALRS